MTNNIYEKFLQLKKKFPATIAWRLKAHSKVVEKFLNPGENILYAFAAQKNNNPLDIVTTYAVVLTNKRILLAQKRLLFGYFYTAITPDLFNDLKVSKGIIWGKVIIDTMKERVFISNIQSSALNEIETNITEYMMNEKQKYTSEQK